MKNSIIFIFLVFVSGCGNSFDGSSINQGTSTYNPNIIDIVGTKNNVTADRDGESGKAGFSSEVKKIASTSLVAKFSSYMGGTFFERIQSVYVDNLGFIYMAGHTQSGNFPVTDNVYDRIKKGPTGRGYDTQDGFVAKLSPEGKLIWATLIGGSRRDQVYAVRTDSFGNIFLLGATGSEDFPSTKGAFDETFNGPIFTNAITDIFVASLTPDGKRLRFSTFIGGSQGMEENPRGALEIDEKRGRIYVAGQTSAPDFPTTKGAFQPKYGGGSQDAVVFALSIDGSKLIASTFIGGSGSDSAFTEIEPHPSGDSYYFAGATNSSDLPVTPGVFQTKLSSGSPKQPWWEDGDAFVGRLSADLDKMIFLTYYGGSRFDAVSHNQGLAVDLQGRVVVIGSTKSSNLPVSKGAFRTTLGASSGGFVAVFSEKGAFVNATYLGSDAYVSGAFIGPHGKIYMTGLTKSADLFVTPDAYQATFGNGKSSNKYTDAFLTVFDPSLRYITYSTFLGGNGTRNTGERGRSIWVTANGRVVVGGQTDSYNFPLTGYSFQTKMGGDIDAFVMIFDPVK